MGLETAAGRNVKGLLQHPGSSVRRASSRLSVSIMATTSRYRAKASCHFARAAGFSARYRNHPAIDPGDNAIKLKGSHELPSLPDKGVVSFTTPSVQQNLKGALRLPVPTLVLSRLVLSHRVQSGHVKLHPASS
jgi:hypothetical protein